MYYTLNNQSKYQYLCASPGSLTVCLCRPQPNFRHRQTKVAKTRHTIQCMFYIQNTYIRTRRKSSQIMLPIYCLFVAFLLSFGTTDGIAPDAETRTRYRNNNNHINLVAGFAAQASVKFTRRPLSLTACTLPPCITMELRTIASPSPVPPTARERPLSTR